MEPRNTPWTVHQNDADKNVIWVENAAGVTVCDFYVKAKDGACTAFPDALHNAQAMVDLVNDSVH